MLANIQKPSNIKDIGHQIHETCTVIHALSGRITLFQMGVINYSDISHDRCHGLNEPATRISGPDFTLMPAYSVVQQ